MAGELRCNAHTLSRRGSIRLKSRSILLFPTRGAPHPMRLYEKLSCPRGHRFLQCRSRPPFGSTSEPARRAALAKGLARHFPFPSRARLTPRAPHRTPPLPTRKWRNRQTRWIQVPVPARAWRFKSSLPHRSFWEELIAAPPCSFWEGSVPVSQTLPPSAAGRRRGPSTRVRPALRAGPQPRLPIDAGASAQIGWVWACPPSPARGHGPRLPIVAGAWAPAAAIGYVGAQRSRGSASVDLVDAPPRPWGTWGSSACADPRASTSLTRRRIRCLPEGDLRRRARARSHPVPSRRAPKST